MKLEGIMEWGDQSDDVKVERWMQEGTCISVSRMSLFAFTCSNVTCSTC
jgi:hypothetical protein